MQAHVMQAHAGGHVCSTMSCAVANGLHKEMRHTLVEGCELAEGASKGATHGGLQPRRLGGHGCQIA